MTRTDADVIATWSTALDHALPEILSSTSTMALASTDPALGPHVAPVFFAADASLTCYFLSDPGTRHGRDIGRVARVAAAIYPDEGDWRRLRGIQLTGSVRMLEGAASHHHGWATYAARFPVATELPEAVAGSALYALTPDWLRVIDNRRGFGYRREWRLVRPTP